MRDTDTIYRQDAIDAVNDCGICIQKIVDLPSAQLQGKWIDDNLINEMYDCLMLANCSVCGYQMDVRHERGYFRYCPNCGADMRR